MRLLIDGTGYVDATDAFLVANRAAALRHGDLVADLSGYTAMAGDSSASADFAETYDAAAADAVGALADVVEAFTTLGRLTCASLANHSSAEERSVLPGTAVSTDVPLPDGLYASVLPASVPSALGGDPSSLPGELSWILDHVEGFVWPDADVGKLRAAATTWRAHADGVASLVDHGDLAIAALGREHSPEVPLAVGAVRDLEGTICDLADQYAAIAGACEQYADQVEEQRAALIDFVSDLLRDSAIIQGIGLGLSLVTAGATGAAAAGVNAARIAAYAPRILEFVALVRRAAEAAAGIIRVAVSGLGRVRAALGRFAGVVVAADARALYRSSIIRRETAGLTGEISVQRQARHIYGTRAWASNEGGYFRDLDDAQTVLNAVHDGSATVLGRTANGNLLVRFDRVTGYNNNPLSGYVDQPTHVFMIKGTTTPSVVPTSPLAKVE